MKKQIFVALCLFFALFAAAATTIEKIEFSGLKRTSKSYAESFFLDLIGKETEEVGVSEIEGRLAIAGLFEKADVSIEGDTIKIDVVEKLSFLPMPFAMYSNDGFMGGLVLMDMNAFGRQDMFMVGGFAAKDHYTGVGFFNKNPRGKVPGFSLSLNVGKKEDKFATIANDSFFSSDKFKVSTGASLNFRLGKYFSLLPGFRYEYQNIEESTVLFGDSFNEKLGDIHIFSPNISARYATKPVWNGFFTYTNSLSLSFDFNVTETGRFAPFLAANLNLNGNVGTPRLVYHVLLSSNSIFNSPMNCYFNNSKASLSILPSNFKTTAIDSLCASLEVATFKSQIALFSFYARYEAAFVRLDYENDFKFTHGPSSGMKMYLSKIAMPAMSIGFSYNASENLFLFAFSAGMGI